MAKKFVFPLAAVERVRELREQEAQRNVATKRAEIAQLDQQNADARAEIAQRQQALLDAQHGGAIDPQGLARGRAWIAHLRGAILQREAMKAELERELETLSARWRETRRELRIIEKLHERRFDAYRRQRAKEEQNDAEEVVRQLQSIEPLL